MALCVSLSTVLFSPSLTNSNTHVCTGTVVDVSCWGLEWGWLGFRSLYFHIKDMSYWWSLTHTILQLHNWYGRAFIKHTYRMSMQTHTNIQNIYTGPPIMFGTSSIIYPFTPVLHIVIRKKYMLVKAHVSVCMCVFLCQVVCYSFLCLTLSCT